MWEESVGRVKIYDFYALGRNSGEAYHGTTVNIKTLKGVSNEKP